MVIQPGLGPPADVERGVNIVQAPFHYLCQFVPVIHFFERHLLNRRTCYDKPVEFPVLYFVKGVVKLQKVFLRSVFGHMSSRMQKSHIHLQRRIAYEPEQLCFRDDFRRHQVEHNNIEGPDILALSPSFRHHEYIFSGQHSCCRQAVRYPDRHLFSTFRVLVYVAIC